MLGNSILLEIHHIQKGFPQHTLIDNKTSTDSTRSNHSTNETSEHLQNFDTFFLAHFYHCKCLPAFLHVAANFSLFWSGIGFRFVFLNLVFKSVCESKWCICRTLEHAHVRIYFVLFDRETHIHRERERESIAMELITTATTVCCICVFSALIVFVRSEIKSGGEMKWSVKFKTICSKAYALLKKRDQERT